jgi:hypothetical protein
VKVVMELEMKMKQAGNHRRRERHQRADLSSIIVAIVAHGEADTVTCRLTPRPPVTAAWISRGRDPWPRGQCREPVR